MPKIVARGGGCRFVVLFGDIIEGCCGGRLTCGVQVGTLDSYTEKKRRVSLVAYSYLKGTCFEILLVSLNFLLNFYFSRTVENQVNIHKICTYVHMYNSIVMGMYVCTRFNQNRFATSCCKETITSPASIKR